MLYLLNAPICHTPGLRYVTRTIGRAEARRLAEDALSHKELTSAIGHDGSAQVLATVLGVPVVTNRITMVYEPGDSAIALQLRKRQPEGVVLSAEMVEEIGYDITLITTAPAPVCVIFGSAAKAARRLAADPSCLPTPIPRDIDVAYGGMDQTEALEIVDAWARRSGLTQSFGHLARDLHPELAEFKRAAVQHSLSGDTRVPQRYEVDLPYPQAGERSELVVIAGAAIVHHRAVDNLSSTMRRMAGSATLEAGKAVAAWIANNRDGLRLSMEPSNTHDHGYKGNSLAGLRSAWAHLIRENNYISNVREREIVEHINGYVAGLGSVLKALAGRIRQGALVDCAEHSRAGMPWGELRVGRVDGGPTWKVSVGNHDMDLLEAVAWLSPTAA